MSRKTARILLIFLVLFSVCSGTQAAIIRLVDGSRAIVKVLALSNKGALVKAEGMEPVFINTEEIEWVAIDERLGAGGFGKGIILLNGLRTYAKTFEISDTGGYIESVHGKILVGNLNDILAIDFRTFGTFKLSDAVRENTMTTVVRREVGAKTVKTVDDCIFTFEKLETQGELFFFENGTIKILAEPTMIKEVNFAGFDQAQARLPGGLVLAFEAGAEMTITRNPDLWFTGKLEKTKDNKLQLTNVVSDFQLNRVRIRRTSFLFKWRFQTGGPIISSPAIGIDGTIYVGSTDRHLYAISPDGKLIWRFATGGEVRSSPAIGDDGTIYFGSSDNHVYALTPDGKLRWRFQTGGAIWSSPAIDKDGTVYVGSTDRFFYAIAPDGKLKWKFETGGAINSSPAIGSDGTLYIGSDDKSLYAISSDGKLLWKVNTNGSVRSGPVMGQGESIYIVSTNGDLYAISPDGKIRWSKYIGNSSSSPVIGTDGTIYVGSSSSYSYLSAFLPDGTNKWNYQTSYIYSSPVVGLDGTIYCGTSDGRLVAIGPNGQFKWNYSIGRSIQSSPAIGPDGMIYFGSDDGFLYALQTTSFGLANSPWPKFRADIRNGGVYTEK